MRAYNMRDGTAKSSGFEGAVSHRYFYRFGHIANFQGVLHKPVDRVFGFFLFWSWMLHGVLAIITRAFDDPTCFSVKEFG